jgi:hypothetical protein
MVPILQNWMMTVAAIFCVDQAKMLQRFVVLLGFAMMVDNVQMQPQLLVFQTACIVLMVITQI